MENRYLIIGLGASGVSCARFLAQQGVPFAVMDSRERPPLLEKFQSQVPDIETYLGGFDDTLLEQAKTIVVSPGVDVTKAPFARHRSKIIGDVELFARVCDKPIIGITGSNGKTTVTTLMGDVLKAAGKKVSVCGNIGRPVLDAWLDDDADIFVVELSSFQLEVTKSLKTKMAVLLNISPDHMDRHGVLDAYLKAKQRIYFNCEYPVVNLDEPKIWESLNLKNIISFSVESNQANFTLNNLPKDELLLKGKHHFQNDLAVLAMASALNIPEAVTLDVLKNFFGLAHRCQLVRELSSIAWYNDSKGTNVGATKTALASVGAKVKGRLIWIAGGEGKDADFTLLNDNLRQYVSHALLYGRDARIIEKAIRDVVPIVHIKNVEEAVQKAAALAKPGDAVLFSPACASFDMFANFEERGKCFQKAVDDLQK